VPDGWRNRFRRKGEQPSPDALEPDPEALEPETPVEAESQAAPETPEGAGPPSVDEDQEGTEAGNAEGLSTAGDIGERRPRHRAKHRAKTSRLERLRRARKEDDVAEAEPAGVDESEPAGVDESEPAGGDEAAPDGPLAADEPLAPDELPAPETDLPEEDVPPDEPPAPEMDLPDVAPPPPAVPARSAGPRRAALQERKSRTRKTQERGLALSIAAAIAVVALGLFVARQVTSSPPAPAPSPSAAAERLQTMLVVGTKQARSGPGSVVWLTLVTYDTKEKHGSVVYIPAHTAVEVPGRGQQTLANSMQTGGIPLLLVTTENLVGLHIDGYVELSDTDARILFQSIGQLQVDVPSEVRVLLGKQRARVIFGKGLQVLPPARLVQLLYTVGEAQDDIEMGTRHVALWHALFDAFAADPGNLVNALRDAGSVMGDTPAAVDEHIALLDTLAKLPPEDRSIAPLPVHPLQVPGDRLYVTDAKEVADFVSQFVGQDDEARKVVRVQILNGRSDAPGVGQDVAARLIQEGYNVILTGNARRLDYKHTLIIVYDTSAATRAIAERTRELLGTGRVQVSTQDQGIVDLTIVVGKDFQRAP
jgi:hypothetical protein